MFQSPSRRTPATRPPLEPDGFAFHAAGPMNLSSPLEYPAEPTILAVYSDPSRFRLSFNPLRNAAPPSPMMVTKCVPLDGLRFPPFSSVAKATSASCILPLSSWRLHFRFTPCLHMRLPLVAW